MGAYADILTEISARLTAATGTGKLLAGVKFIATPRVEAIGRVDLPEVRLFLPTITETHTARQPSVSTLVVRLLVGSDRSSGVPALALLVEKVVDAVGQTTAGKRDPLMGGRVADQWPWQWNAGEAEDVSITAELLLTMTATKAPVHGAHA